jgi:hypothetical protein
MKKTVLVLCALALTGLSLKGATKSFSLADQASPQYHQVTLADLPAGQATWILTADPHLDGNVTNTYVNALSITIGGEPGRATYTISGHYINSDTRNQPPLPSNHLGRLEGQIFSVPEPDLGHIAFRHVATGLTIMPVVTFTIWGRHNPDAPADYDAFSGRFENGNVNAIKGTWTNVDGGFGDFEMVKASH